MNRSEEVYDSLVRPAPAIDEILGLVKYRELLFQFVSRAIKTRYKRSFLGIVWTLLNPLLTMIVLTLVFSNLFRFSLPYYHIYILSGLIGWSFFTSATQQAMTDMLYNGGLLNRIYMPRSIFAVSAICTAIVNLGFSLVPLTLIALLTGGPLNFSLLSIFPAIIILASFSLGVGLFLATAAVFFADVIPVYEVLLTIWLYATPIIYPLDIIPEKWLWLFKLNPMLYIVNLFRQPLYSGTMAPLGDWLISLSIALVVLLLGWVFFTSKSNEYAYRV